MKNLSSILQEIYATNANIAQRQNFFIADSLCEKRTIAGSNFYDILWMHSLDEKTHITIEQESFLSKHKDIFNYKVKVQEADNPQLVRKFHKLLICYRTHYYTIAFYSSFKKYHKFRKFIKNNFSILQALASLTEYEKPKKILFEGTEAYTFQLQLTLTLIHRYDKKLMPFISTSQRKEILQGTRQAITIKIEQENDGQRWREEAVLEEHYRKRMETEKKAQQFLRKIASQQKKAKQDYVKQLQSKPKKYLQQTTKTSKIDNHQSGKLKFEINIQSSKKKSQTLKTQRNSFIIQQFLSLPSEVKVNCQMPDEKPEQKHNKCQFKQRMIQQQNAVDRETQINKNGSLFVSKNHQPQLPYKKAIQIIEHWMDSRSNWIFKVSKGKKVYWFSEKELLKCGLESKIERYKLKIRQAQEQLKEEIRGEIE